MTEKGCLKMNVKKMKPLCTGVKTVAMEASKFPCSACRSRVGKKCEEILCVGNV